MRELLDLYFETLGKVHEGFGYVEDWCVFPLQDSRKAYWTFDGETVRFADSTEELFAEDEEAVYENELYRNRFLKQWVFEKDGFTMMLVDTHSDGNRYLQVFDNAKRVEEEKP